MHELVGATWPPLAQTLSRWDTLKCLTGSENLCLEAKQQNPDLIIVYRALNVCIGMSDGPLVQWWWNGSEWYSCISRYWPAGFDYYEIVNEVGPPNDDFGLFAQFSIQVATEATRNGQCILAFSFPPGNPELRFWGDLLAYMQWADTHPCGRWSDGSLKYHGIAWHAPLFLEGPVRQGSWINNDWVAGRAVLADELLRQTSGYSFNDFKGPIYCTECGYTDGYSGSWDDRFDCFTKAEGLDYSIEVLEETQPFLTGFHYWNVGGPPGTRWTNDENCLPLLAQYQR